MSLRRTLLRARWVLLLVPLFALGSTLQVGCVGGSDQRDDYVHEDPKDENNVTGYPGTKRPPTGYYDDDYPYYGGGYYDDDGYGY